MTKHAFSMGDFSAELVLNPRHDVVDVEMNFRGELTPESRLKLQAWWLEIAGAFDSDPRPFHTVFTGSERTVEIFSRVAPEPPAPSNDPAEPFEDWKGPAS